MHAHTVIVLSSFNDSAAYWCGVLNASSRRIFGLPAVGRSRIVKKRPLAPLQSSADKRHLPGLGSVEPALDRERLMARLHRVAAAFEQEFSRDEVLAKLGRLAPTPGTGDRRIRITTF